MYQYDSLPYHEVRAVNYNGIAAKVGHNPLTGEAKGVVLVDDRDFGLEKCGELVQSGVAAKNIVELGEIALRKGREEPRTPDQGA